MTRCGTTMLGLLCIVLAGCISPEQQHAMDLAKCQGFGFSQGTDAMANCMMNVSQQREAEMAAQQRENARNQMFSNQMEQNRQAAQQAADAAASAQHENDIMKMMNANGSSGFGGMPSINPAGCTFSSSGNAGSMSCH